MRQLHLSSSARPVIDWAKTESLESLLPKEDLFAILSELQSNPLLINDSEELVSKNWESLERKLQSEERTVRQIIGEQTTERLLRSVQNLNEYDPDAVKAFLGSEAVNTLFARVLYDGIFEFVQKVRTRTSLFASPFLFLPHSRYSPLHLDPRLLNLCLERLIYLETLLTTCLSLVPYGNK